MKDRRGNSVERYYASKRKKHKRRKVKLYFTLSLFCIVAFIVLSLTVFFNIRTFSVQGNNIYTEEQILSAAGLTKGDNMFRLNKFKLAEKLALQLPYIGSVEIYRKLPATLCIDVQETKARMVAYKGGEYILLDQSLKVLEKRQEVPKDVAYLIGCNVKEAEIGHKVVFEKETTKTAVEKLTTALYEHFDPVLVSAIDVSELHALRVYYDNHHVKLILGNGEQLQDKLQMAKKAISQNGTAEIARIDITNPSTAYYRPLDEEEMDDPLLMLQGKAKAKEEKSYESPVEEETEEES